MTTFLLIRHASTDAIGKWIAGRQPGVGLNEQGVAEAERLANRLTSIPITAVYSSPLERTRQTVIPLCRKLGISNVVSDEINEIDFGEWTGKTFAELDNLPAWRRFNQFRSSTRIPGGESMPEVTMRMVNALEVLSERHGSAIVAVFSHGDPLRALLAHYAGMPIDFLVRVDISPASISVIDLQPTSVQILALNDTGRFCGPNISAEAAANETRPNPQS